jgi:hypothetical protein
MIFFIFKIAQLQFMKVCYTELNLNQMKRIEKSWKNPRLSPRQSYQSDGGTGVTQSGPLLLVDVDFTTPVSMKILITELHGV